MTQHTIWDSQWLLIKKKRNRPIIGENVNNELDVIAVKKWIHVSSFKPHVSEDNIIEYVEKHIKISKEHLVCYKLVKKDADASLIKKVSFKIGVSPIYYDELFKPSVWPSSVRVRPFKFFQKQQQPVEKI
ncbi:uncharacterized protein LOC142239962 [Haematobia irritans]|uniref:uncharacterized protein LOC142239962 n=1 Tax=Haematobia irritans TaxID=7368 RepID=UPI003F508565